MTPTVPTVAPTNGDALVSALRGALPWLTLHRGSTFVVKLGGSALDDGADVKALVDQLALLHALGIKVVVVHGGGNQITRASEAFGVEVKKVGGRRVTDAKTLEVAAMVLNGSVRTRLLAAFRNSGVRAVGVSGVDAGLIRAEQRKPTPQADGSTLDWGLVGDVIGVDPTLVQDLLAQDLVVCVSPLSADDQGQVLNVNADVVAAQLAVSLQADKLLLVSDVPGIYGDRDDADSLVVMTDLMGLDHLEASGAIAGGMLPKVACLRTALRGGVKRAHVIAHHTPDSVLREVFTNEGAGTLIVPDAEALVAAVGAK